MSDVLHIVSMRNQPESFPDKLREYGFDSILLRDLTLADFHNRKVILIDGHSDQRALCCYTDAMEQHLTNGGTVVFNGHLEYPVFHGLDMFQVAQGRGFNDLMIERVNPHPIFDNVDCQDLSVRRGVAGFYARGANPPPDGAVVLHRLIKDHSPVDWVWQRPTGGQILMHSGNNMWMYINDETSTGRIVPQLIDWILAGAKYEY